MKKARFPITFVIHCTFLTKTIRTTYKYVHFAFIVDKQRMEYILNPYWEISRYIKRSFLYRFKVKINLIRHV